jgi:hypothetical protein
MQNINSKTRLYNTFLVFLRRFECAWLQSLQKVLNDPKSFFHKNYKSVLKNIQFDSDFKSEVKITKMLLKPLYPNAEQTVCSYPSLPLLFPL